MPIILREEVSHTRRIIVVLRKQSSPASTEKLKENDRDDRHNQTEDKKEERQAREEGADFSEDRRIEKNERLKKKLRKKLISGKKDVLSYRQPTFGCIDTSHSGVCTPGSIPGKSNERTCMRSKPNSRLIHAENVRREKTGF